jgi:4'-phosphopantetheinyl transferase
MAIHGIPLEDAARILPRNEVHLYFAGIGSFSSSVERFRETLSDGETARARRIVSEKDRRKYVVVRGLLRALLGGYLGAVPSEIEIVPGCHGKPMLAGASGRDAIRFNVSHSGERVLFGFARGREVGVDMEEVRRGFPGEEIGDRFFTPAEAARIRSVRGARRQEVFFSYWTLKEAFMKASGSGFFLPMHRFEVALDPPRIVKVEGDPEAASRWRLEILSPGAGHAAALAVDGGNAPGEVVSRTQGKLFPSS